MTVPNVICEARVDGVCQGRAQHMHHIVLRSRGGSNDLSNLLAVCSACHDWIHGNPLKATELGLMRRKEAS